MKYNKVKFINFLNKAILVSLYIFSFFSFTSKSMTSTFGGLVVIFGLIKFLLDRQFILVNKKVSIAVILFITSVSISIMDAFSLQSFDSLGKFILLILFYFIIINNLKERDNIKKLILLTFISICFASFYGLYQYFVLDMPRVRGFMLTLGFGGALAIFINYFAIFTFWGKFNKFKKIAFILLGIVFIANLIFNGSRSAWVALLFGIYIIFIIKLPKLTIISTLIFFILLILMPQSYINNLFETFDLKLDRSNLARVALWKGSILMWKDNLINGVGLDNFQEIYTSNYIQPNTGTTVNAHNNFLQFAAETGTIGLLSFIYLIYRSLEFLYKAYLKISNKNWSLFLLGSFIAFIIFYFQGLADVNFFEDTSIKFFWFWIALNVSLMKVLK